MKNCPYCGEKFNWWQRATGENKDHIRSCCDSHARKDDQGLANICRGCPAGCFEKAYDKQDNK